VLVPPLLPVLSGAAEGGCEWHPSGVQVGGGEVVGGGLVGGGELGGGLWP
jgi:hypothetical protein